MSNLGGRRESHHILTRLEFLYAAKKGEALIFGVLNPNNKLVILLKERYEEGSNLTRCPQEKEKCNDSAISYLVKVFFLK